MANFKIALAVHALGGLDGSVKSVLLHLSLYTAVDNGGRIYASDALLVCKTGYSKSTLRRAIAVLQRDGWIAVSGERKQRIKGYAICLEKLGLTAEDIQPKRRVTQPIPQEESYPAYEQGLPAAASSVPHSAREQLRGKQSRWQTTEEQRKRMEKAFGLE